MVNEIDIDLLIKEIINENTSLAVVLNNMHSMFVYYSMNKAKPEVKYQSLFEDYNNYVRKVGHWSPPKDLASKVEKSFLLYIRDVFSGRYQGKFENHSSFPAVKAGMDAIIQHAKENPEYYELRDLIGN